MKAFSVVIPFYNRASVLPRALSSIAAQTYRPIQLVLVDNASTDKSNEVCQKFKESHQRADFEIIITEEPQKGAAIARNKGLLRVTSEWVAFFDSDDEMSPTFLSEVQIAFEESQADVVAASTCMVFPNGKKKRRFVYHTKSVTDQILTGMLATQGMCFRAEYLRKLGGWLPVPIWNDWLLGIKLLLNKPHLIWLPKSYHSIYQHSESITGTSFSANYKQLKHTLCEAEKLLNTTSQSGSREIAALTARKIILAGQLYRESNLKAANELRTSCMQNKSKGLNSIVSHFLYLYTRLGGRGAWWIARYLLPKK